jgi:serine/threonine-protein kinase
MSAKEQYLKAMFEVDNADAFQAVIEYFPGDDDKIWRRRAEEQLTLLYLKDRRRKDQAFEQLQRLRDKIEPGDAQLRAESRAAEAYWNAMYDNPTMARKILQSEADNFNKYLNESWRRVADEARQLAGEPGRSGGTPAPTPGGP